MPSVVHVVATANFAGVERYVSNVARETVGRGWDVAVVGGHPEQMPVELGERSGLASWRDCAPRRCARCVVSAGVTSATRT